MLIVQNRTQYIGFLYLKKDLQLKQNLQYHIQNLQNTNIQRIAYFTQMIKHPQKYLQPKGQDSDRNRDIQNHQTELQRNQKIPQTNNKNQPLQTLEISARDSDDDQFIDQSESNKFYSAIRYLKQHSTLIGIILLVVLASILVFFVIHTPIEDNIPDFSHHQNNQQKQNKQITHEEEQSNNNQQNKKQQNESQQTQKNQQQQQNKQPKEQQKDKPTDKTNETQQQTQKYNNNVPADAWYDIVYLNTTDALCLDGTPAHYYISRDGDPSRIILYFQWGGWCYGNTPDQTLNDFLIRSRGPQGSSKRYPESLLLNGGIRSTHQTNYFRAWKRVFFPYCDGAGHQGYRKQPLVHQGRTIYVRGHNITMDRLDSVQQQLGLFSKAKQVVVSGASAGALAVFLWENYIAQRVKAGKVWALSDSGIFLDAFYKYNHQKYFKLKIKNMMHFSNQQVDPPVPQCIKQFSESKEQCMMAETLFKYLKVPTFAIESLSDIWCLPNILGLPCDSQDSCQGQDKKMAKQYRINLQNLLQDFGKNTTHGYWAPSTPSHATLGSWIQSRPIPTESNNTLMNCIKGWMEGTATSNTYMDVFEQN